MKKLIKKKYADGGPLGKKKPAPKQDSGPVDAGIPASVLNEYLVKRKPLDQKGMKKIADYEKSQQPKKGMKMGGSLKPVPAGKKGLAKLPKPVRNKMGYQKMGGKTKK